MNRFVPRRTATSVVVALLFSAVAAMAPAAYARRQQNGPPAKPILQSPLVASAAVGNGYDGAKSQVSGAGSVFKPQAQVIHLGVRLKKLRAGAKVRGVLTAVDAGGVRNHKVVEQTLSAAVVNNVHFQFSLPRPWPVGQYRIDVYIDGKKELSLPYRVKG